MSELLTPTEVADKLKISVGTLNVWRATKRVPLAYVKVGGAVRYRADDVQKYVDSRTVTPAAPTA